MQLPDSKRVVAAKPKAAPKPPRKLIPITPALVKSVDPPTIGQEDDEQISVLLNDAVGKPLFAVSFAGIGIGTANGDYDGNYEFSSCCALGEMGNINAYVDEGVSNAEFNDAYDEYYEDEDKEELGDINPYDAYAFLRNTSESGLMKFLDVLPAGLRTSIADLVFAEHQQHHGGPRNLVLSVPIDAKARTENFTYFLVDNATNIRKGPMILSNDGLRHIQTYIWSYRLPKAAQKK